MRWDLHKDGQHYDLSCMDGAPSDRTVVFWKMLTETLYTESRCGVIEMNYKIKKRIKKKKKKKDKKITNGDGKRQVLLNEV